MKKKMYCTLDTETVGGCTHPEGFYHIGGFVHDRKGKVYGAFNILVAEMFDKIRDDEYAKKNWERYAEMASEGVATMVDTEDNAVQFIDDLCSYYGVDTMMAFNSGFDFGKTKAGKLIEHREFIDLYLMALQTIGQRKGYANFCRANGLLSRSGKCIASSAESFHAWLTNNPAYSEEHTALEDARIEMGIFLASIKTHLHYDKNIVLYDHPNKFSYFVRATA